MKFFEKMYVGFQRDRYLRADKPRVLGFAVPYGTTAAEKKRFKTVDDWADKPDESKVIDNVPTRGFKILSAVTRYSTSNKLFRVQDPRGFELEITADNMVDLCLSSTIVKGEVIDECVWSQENKIYLIPVSDVRYQASTKASEAVKKQEPGKFYKHADSISTFYRYEGTFHHTFLEFDYEVDKYRTERDQTARSYYGSYYNVIEEYTKIATIKMNSGKKPTVIYTEFVVNDDGEITRHSFHARKSPIKDLFDMETDDIPKDVKDIQFDKMAFVNEQGGWRSNKNLVCNSSSDYSAFFDTREEAKNFDYQKVIENSHNPSNYSLHIKNENDWGHRVSYYNNQVSPAVKKNIKIIDKR